MGYTRTIERLNAIIAYPKETINVGVNQSLGGCGCRLLPGLYKADQDSAKLEARGDGDTLLPVAPLDGAGALVPAPNTDPSTSPLSLRQPPGALRLRTAWPAFRPPNHRRARPTKQCSLRARVESPIPRPTRREKRRGEVCVSVVFTPTAATSLSWDS
jgi:hypothetical protein